MNVGKDRVLRPVLEFSDISLFSSMNYIMLKKFLDARRHRDSPKNSHAYPLANAMPNAISASLRLSCALPKVGLLMILGWYCS